MLFLYFDRNKTEAYNEEIILEKNQSTFIQKKQESGAQNLLMSSVNTFLFVCWLL
jgi:hypothetical protein